jgi:hypothetical protein
LLIDRRHALALGLGAAGSLLDSSRAFAQFTGAPGPYSRPEHRSARRPGHRPSAILFWHDTALQLVALDHSIDAKDARAPGPCASSRALALAHIVMADAVAAVYPARFEGLCVRGERIAETEFPDVFVAGATARMLEHIYSTPAHTQFIGLQRLRFLERYDQRALQAWNAGLTFGRDTRFLTHWSWETVKDMALSSLDRAHSLRRGDHDVDPFNPDQKYYGVKWGRMPPLMSGLAVRSMSPGDPPDERDREYIRDLEEVKALGAFRPGGPTADQVKIGLFWAYDGARLIGTPPRLYNQFVRQIAEHDGLADPDLARLFALCNVAMADAGIACWEAKYRYQVWRPVLGIPNAIVGAERDWRPFGSPRTNPAQFALGSDSDIRLTAQSMLGGGFAVPQRVKDVLPYHQAAFSPNFPAYPSGHAMFGSACFNTLMRVRAEYLGRDAGRLTGLPPFVSDELNGISIDNFRNQPRPYLPVAYTHIEQMIKDNDRSRVHLGVHWHFDCEAGSRAGARVADAVYRGAYRRY